MTDQRMFITNARREPKEDHLRGGRAGASAVIELGPDQILTIPEVAKYLKLSRSKVYALVASHALPYLKMGRNVRIRESDLRAWIEANLVSST